MGQFIELAGRIINLNHIRMVKCHEESREEKVVYQIVFDLGPQCFLSLAYDSADERDNAFVSVIKMLGAI
jgi:hypothetical protein